MKQMTDSISLPEYKRDRLPNRRSSIAFVFEFESHRYRASASWFDDGRIGEIFLDTQKPDTPLQLHASTAAILTSLLLQSGVPAETIQHSVSGPIPDRAGAFLRHGGRQMMNRPEDQIQRAVFQHFRARKTPGTFAFHVPNGGKRRRIEASIMKGLGVTAGVPDIIAIHGGHTFALELKADGGHPTAKQIETMAEMEKAGATVTLAKGLDAAIAQLEAWGLMIGHAS